jgi:TonB family protein
MLEAFAARRIDPNLVKRLVVGTCAGIALVFSVGFYFAKVAKNVMAAEPEEEAEPIVPVALVETTEEKPEEPIETPPDEPDPDPGPRVRGPAPPSMPTEVPEHQKMANAQEAYGDGDKPIQFGDGGGGGSGKGKGPAAPKKEEKKEEPKPKAAKPKLSPEDYDPPKCKASRIDAAAAKAAGVEGTVVVKYTVTETGAVTNVAVVSGPPELHSLALAAAQRTTCQPARLKADGSAISISRKVPFRVRFSTN